MSVCGKATRGYSVLRLGWELETHELLMFFKCCFYGPNFAV